MKAFWTIGALLSIAGAAWAGPLTPPAAPAETKKPLEEVEPRTPISSLPFTITESGSYYVTKNLTSSGEGIGTLSSTSLDITIDLNGFTLTGPDTNNFDSGIRINGGGSLTVKNGHLRRWSFYGVFLTGAAVHVENVHVVDAGVGIQASGATGLVQNCSVNEPKNDSELNPTGISASNLVVKGCSVSDASGFTTGISVSSSVVSNCVVSLEFGVAFSTAYSRISNSLARDPGVPVDVTAFEFKGDSTVVDNQIQGCEFAFKHDAGRAYAARNILMNVSIVDFSPGTTHGTGDNANVSLP